MRIDCHSQPNFYTNRDIVHETFFNDIRKYPLLTEEEEIELLTIYKTSTDETERENAKNRLIECNLRFVASIAKKFGEADNFLDSVNEGNLGLIRAIEKFDLNKKCRLISYAVSWIVTYISNYQLTQVKSVVPPGIIKLHNYVKNVKRKFYAENERNPTSQELAEMIRKKFNFKVTSFDDVELSHMISISEKYYSSDNTNTVEESDEFVTKTCNNNIEESINDEYTKYKLDFFLGKLTDREKFIVERCYGIGCVQESFETIGLQLDLCGERVRQICSSAVKKMQGYKEKVKNL